MKARSLSVVLIVVLILVYCVASQTLLAATPQVMDDRLELTLVASEPEIVTPVGATFDRQGRLLVVEVHTHFPPADYVGPKHDRIRIVEDTDGDGRADRFRTFYEGTQFTMSLAAGPGDWIYVATRMKVFRIRDTDGDDMADEEEEIAHLDTRGNYPHNGLSGLSFDHQGRLIFGLGENLGEPYTLIGRDGTKLSGGGEGGNVYRCAADGSHLEQLATGFWNPFGICVDPHDRIFCVGNDPDSMPPCRLMHVVPGGDYGYQFRYGRSGKHPLQAWDGELPGTLPMVDGTGEAPCAVLPYHGKLWVTSWGDYRIERYTLEPRGASFGASLDVVVQGDEHFRPVDFAVAPDGSLYFTDWVDRSYPVHGKGRIWRLSWKSTRPETEFPAVSPAEQLAADLASGANANFAKYLGDADPFLRNAAVEGLVHSGQLAKTDRSQLKSASAKVALLEAARRSQVSGEERNKTLSEALSDDAPDVRLYALRWIADEKLNGFRSQVEETARSKNTTPALFQAAVATLEWLDTGKVANLKQSHPGHYFANVLREQGWPDSVVTMALRSLPPDHDSLTTERLQQLATSGSIAVRREAVRTLALQTNPARFEVLAAIAGDESYNEQLRADAVFGLAQDPAHRGLLGELAKSKSAALRQAATLALEPAKSVASATVSPEETEAWLKQIEAEKPDVAAGWRIFFGSGKCATCHTLQGRGGTIGPDLTSIAARMPRARMVQSILEPSREIAPRYVPWVIESESGQTFTGIALNRQGGRRQMYEVFVGNDGKEHEILASEIAARFPSRTSIMPAGFEKILDAAALRDLIGLLEESAGSTTEQ